MKRVACDFPATLFTCNVELKWLLMNFTVSFNPRAGSIVIDIFDGKRLL